MRLSMSSFTSSISHPHPLCRSSHSQMFFKIDVPKNFANFAGKHRRFPVKLAKFLRAPFFTEHLWWLLLSMLLFMMFLFLLLHCCTFTTSLKYCYFFRLKKHFRLYITTTTSYTIIITEWFIRIAATTMTYSTATSMIAIRISALLDFMLKQ